MTWFGDRRGPWLGRPTPEKPVRPRVAGDPSPVVDAPAGDAGDQYAVPYLPVRCPRCRRGDQVQTYSTRLRKSPPTRYHECGRCAFKFRSYEVDEGPDGGLVLWGST